MSGERSAETEKLYELLVEDDGELKPPLPQDEVAAAMARAVAPGRALHFMKLSRDRQNSGRGPVKAPLSRDMEIEAGQRQLARIALYEQIRTGRFVLDDEEMVSAAAGPHWRAASSLAKTAHRSPTAVLKALRNEEVLAWVRARVPAGSDLVYLQQLSDKRIFMRIPPQAWDAWLTYFTAIGEVRQIPIHDACATALGLGKSLEDARRAAEFLDTFRKELRDRGLAIYHLAAADRRVWDRAGKRLVRLPEEEAE